MQDTHEQAVDELKQVCRQWDKAIEANDASAIGKFMADDWVILGTEGGLSSRSQFLGFIKSGDLLHNSMDFEDLRVNVYDNTGIVISKGTSSGTYKSEAFSYYEWSTSVFIKKEGRWLAVFTMLTPVEKTTSVRH